MGDVTKTEFLLNIYIYNIASKKNPISIKHSCLVACQKIGGVTYHLMTTSRQDIYGWEFEKFCLGHSWELNHLTLLGDVTKTEFLLTI